MNFEKKAERINKAHQLITASNTGKPEEFAYKLNINKSQIYNLIELLKKYDAPIYYSKKINSFYYSKPFNLEFQPSLIVLQEEEKRELFGENNFHPILLEGNILDLY